MKKIIYLFLALLIVACSSDDSSDGDSDNNQLFLEKYDGVVWEWDGSFDTYTEKIAFINSSKSITDYTLFPDEEWCYTWPIATTTDYEYSDGVDGSITISIQEETENSIAILFKINDEDYEEEGFVHNYTVTSNGIYQTLTRIQVNDNGNYYEGDDLTVYSRTDDEVCF
jgi:hypothetical protein